MNPHYNLDVMKLVAVEQAKKHNCNYNIIIHNPDAVTGEYVEYQSTYEMVADSYFDNKRNNVTLLYKTDDLIEAQNKPKAIVVGHVAHGATFIGVNDKTEGVVVIDDLSAKTNTWAINRGHSDFEIPMVNSYEKNYSGQKKFRKQNNRKKKSRK